MWLCLFGSSRTIRGRALTLHGFSTPPTPAGLPTQVRHLRPVADTQAHIHKHMQCCRTPPQLIVCNACLHADPLVGITHGNQAIVNGPADIQPPSIPTAYSFQIPLYIYQQSNTSAGLASGVQLPLILPYPALSTECSNQTTVGFFVNIPVSQKVRNSL